MHYPFNNNLKPKQGLLYANQAGNRQQLSEGDKAAAKYLYWKSTNLTAPDKQQIGDITATSFSFHKTPQWIILKTKGDNYFKNENYKQAYKFYVALINEYGDYVNASIKADLYNRCGCCACEWQDFQNAKSCFAEADRLSPNTPNYVNNLRAAESDIRKSQAPGCTIL